LVLGYNPLNIELFIPYTSLQTAFDSVEGGGWVGDHNAHFSISTPIIVSSLEEIYGSVKVHVWTEYFSSSSLGRAVLPFRAVINAAGSAIGRIPGAVLGAVAGDTGREVGDTLTDILTFNMPRVPTVVKLAVALPLLLAVGYVAAIFITKFVPFIG
jgi:hypothetical protein